MEQDRIRLMEKLDRCFVERLRQSAEAGEGYPADLVEVYEYLKGTRLRDSEVCTLLRYADPLRVALLCWKRNINRNVFDLRFLLAQVEGNAVRPVLIVGVRFPSTVSSRKRREMLTGGQQILYGGRVPSILTVPD